MNHVLARSGPSNGPMRSGRKLRAWQKREAIARLCGWCGWDGKTDAGLNSARRVRRYRRSGVPDRRLAAASQPPTLRRSPLSRPSSPGVKLMPLSAAAVPAPQARPVDMANAGVVTTGLLRRSCRAAGDHDLLVRAWRTGYPGISSTPASTTASSRSGAVRSPGTCRPAFQMLALSVSPGNTTPANRAP